LLDDQGQVLFSPNTDELMSSYPGTLSLEPAFYDLPAPRGTRDLVYSQPVVGRSWTVVLTIPAERAQQMA